MVCNGCHEPRNSSKHSAIGQLPSGAEGTPEDYYCKCLFTLSLSIVMVAIMLWYSFEFWHLTWERDWKSDTIWGVRLWIPYLALPVGFALFLLQLIADMVAILLKIEKPFGLEDA